MTPREPLIATRRVPARAGEFMLACGDHTFTVRPWDDGVLALVWEADPVLPWTPAVIQQPVAEQAVTVRERPGAWRLAAPPLTLLVREAPFSITLGTPQNENLWGAIAVAMEGDRLVLSGALDPDDAIYGLGEQNGYLDRRGRSYTMWNTDETGPHIETLGSMYQSIPFMITWHAGQAVGWLFDDPGRTHFDLGHDDPSAWRFEADGPGLTLYVLAGPTPADVLARYGRLTGRMPLPPRWALGYHQSRWSYDSAEEVTALATEFRQREIPADVIHLDIAYMDGYRVFTWDPIKFPDPKGLMTGLKEQGFRAVTIVDPGVKIDIGFSVYETCATRRLYVRLPGGRPFIGEVWPGDCVFPDFSRPETRTWWGSLHRDWLETGVAGIWNDMNEPSVFRGPAVSRTEQTMPPEVLHGDLLAPVPHRQAHNLYGMQMSQATRDGMLAVRPDERPFVISRAGFAGIQRYAMVWTGDNHSIWAHLEQGVAMCLGLGLSGVAFVGPDVGGFMGDCTGELLVRWTQVGALTPFFRNHSALGTRRQEPWTFGEQVEVHCRTAIALRYRLLPAIYTAFQQAAETGVPIMRPLWLTHPGDRLARTLHDQYFFGPDMLVAPVMRPGATHRLVYFPEPGFVDFHTGDVMPGGHVAIATPLTHLPLFVRGGIVLPLAPPAQNTEAAWDVLTLRLFPGDRLSGGWYDDDGRSLAHQKGGFNMWRFTGERAAGRMSLNLAREAEGFASPTRRLELQVPMASPPTSVRFAGEAMTDWRHAEGMLTVNGPLLSGEWVIEGGEG